MSPLLPFKKRPVKAWLRCQIEHWRRVRASEEMEVNPRLLPIATARLEVYVAVYESLFETPLPVDGNGLAAAAVEGRTLTGRQGVD